LAPRLNIGIPVLRHYAAMPVNYVTRPTTGCLTFPVCPNARHVKLSQLCRRASTVATATAADNQS